MVPGSCKIHLDHISQLLWVLTTYFFCKVAQGASDVGLAWIYKEKFQ